MSKKNKKNGFTLVEVLAVLVLISIVLTFAFKTYNYIIDKSKNKAVSISLEKIKSAAEVYSKENNYISTWWGYESENQNYRFYCTTIQDLINNGYFGTDLINKSITSDNGINNNSLIKIVKDIKNMTIIKTEITNETDVTKCNQSISEDIVPTQTDNYTFRYYFNRGQKNDYSEIAVSRSLSEYTLINIEREGYLFTGWYSNKYGGTKIGDSGSKINLSDLGINYSIALYAHWIPNPNYKRVDIQLDINGGKLVSNESSPIGLNGSLLTLDGSNTIHTIIYGQTLGEDGLANWNNANYIKLEKKGYTIKENAVWCKTPNSNGKDCYDQKTQYKFEDFCKDTTKNCIVTLYANWKPSGYDVRFDSKLGLEYPNTYVDGAIIFNGNTAWPLGLYNASVATIYVKFSTDEIGTKQNIIGNQQKAGFGLRITETGILTGELYLEEKADYITVSSKNSLEANKEYTAVLTYGQYNLILYLDGEQQDSKPLNGDKPKQPEKTILMMGCNPSQSTCEGAYFKGKIYSLKMFTKGMTATEINKIDEEDTVYQQLFKEVNESKKNTNVLRITRKPGEKLGTLPRIYRLGYTFEGWYTDEATPRMITSDEVVGPPPEGKDATTYNAKWNNNPYTIIFNGNGNTGGSTENKECSYDKNCTLTDNGYIKTGHNFDGWAKTSNGEVLYSNKEVVKNLVTSGTITLYAKWSAKKLTIALDNQGATTSGTTKIYLNPNVKWYLDSEQEKWMKADENPIKKPTKTYYSFQGYYTDKSGNGDKIIQDTGYIVTGKTGVFSTNGTIYASWKDTTKPSCTTSKSNTGTTSGVTVTVTCSDDGDGCKQTTYTYTGVKSDTTYTVEDKAGNTNTCKVTVTKTSQTRYYTRGSCKTANSCRAAACETWGSWVNDTCFGTDANACSRYANNNKTTHYDYQCIYTKGCSSVTGAKTFAQVRECATHKKDESKCGCATYYWDGPTSWSTSSCTETSTRDCEYRTLYS